MDAYEADLPMGVFAERTVEAYQFTREAQDAFAIESLARAKRANEDGSFADEIAPLEIPVRGGTQTIDKDEQPFKGPPRQDSAASSPPSRRTAPSLQPMPVRSRTAPPPWS